MTNAARLVKAGANAVKLEGGRRSAKAVRRMTEAGIPVMGHLGYTPQSANAFGRKVVRGRGQEGDELLADALALQEAGCFAIVLEAVPAELGTHHRGRRGGHHRHRRRARHRRPGAGHHRPARADPDPTPRFVKRYADLRSLITEAAGRFAKDVAEGHYPGPEHQYH